MASKIPFDPVALGLDGVFIDPASVTPTKRGAAKRAKKPKATRQEKAAVAPKLTPLQAAALAIADPEAREREGRRLHAVLRAKIEALTGERQALRQRPPFSAEQDAEVWARHRDQAEVTVYGSSAYKTCRRDYNELADIYMDQINGLSVAIESARQEQISVSHAYAHPHVLAGYAAIEPWIAAAQSQARRRYNAETAAIIQQWIAEGARFVTIAEVVAIIEARKKAAEAAPRAEPVRRQSQRLRAKDFRPPAQSKPRGSPPAAEDEPTGGM
jgi:hypothetical protein